MSEPNWCQLAADIKTWARELGFARVGISDIDLSGESPRLQAWLDRGYHGSMAYMARHQALRLHPEALQPGTVRVISVRMDYLPAQAGFARTLGNPALGYVSRYALGRDYHKLIRNRLKQLGQRINQVVNIQSWRPFVDSAPILERPLAAKAGLGWVGKHSLLLDAEAGSWFFLGELLVSLPLPVDQPVTERIDHKGCGECVACMTICPTGAIVEPYVVDARRCISYLTIEHPGIIDESLRPLMGNRIYGCDDCQLICPWNRFASTTREADFSPRQCLEQSDLLSLFAWDETTFLKKTEGSPIRRIGHERWQRNIAVALGNAPASPRIVQALEAALPRAPELVAVHLRWALAQQRAKLHQALPALSRTTARLIRAVEKGLPRDA